MVRVHSVDGMRAIAASLVVFHHLGAASMGASFGGRLISSATASGVELFFVLSGVVLGRQYIREGRQLVFKTYLIRRVQRLWPPFLAAWLLAGAVVGLITVWPTWWSASAGLPSFSASAWLEQAFILNWWSPPYNFAWWTLTIELSFYALLPPLVVIFRHLRKNAALLASVLIGSLLLSIFAYGGFGFVVIRGLVDYASCFAAGLLIATRDISRRLSATACFCGAILVVVSADNSMLNPHVGWGLIYLGVVSLAMNIDTRFAQALSRDAVVWLGERSYSLFLTHYTVIAATCWVASLAFENKGFLYFACTRILAIPLILLTAMLLFTFVEVRFATGLATKEQFWPWRPRRTA